MAAAEVMPLNQPDPALQEEARIAADIVQGIRHGADSAETMLVKRYSRGLQYFLMRRVNDQERARDLLQETLCIAIVKLRKTDLDKPERLAGYLRGIAIRVAMNAGRRRKREPYLMESEALAEIPDNAPRPFQFVAREQSIETVRAMLRTMPIARDRELLTRYYVRDENKEDICKALNLDSLHFNRVLFRAKGRFKKLLEARVADHDLDPR
ncbi:MAG: sigma-70 family RNA polymerase sigma factor [Gammaproteobacteria bacterium]|nr:sigma-70 family RNA polymerase sigma factor [Gammaproteobacteria bacterium]